ncbi:hypothetical protein BX600DRAFT_510024 [Xylariales sp. PMI_506]|nr:hypothetical protein BX600DRAFT_510024 [Xylariales sp. PMI_506]
MTPENRPVSLLFLLLPQISPDIEQVGPFAPPEIDWVSSVLLVGETLRPGLHLLLAPPGRRTLGPPSPVWALLGMAQAAFPKCQGLSILTSPERSIFLHAGARHMRRVAARTVHVLHNRGLRRDHLPQAHLFRSD